MNPGRGIPFTLDGRTQCLKHWAFEFNISYTTVKARIRAGADLRTALTAKRQGDGYRGAGYYGIPTAWREWISAPIVTENNLTSA